MHTHTLTEMLESLEGSFLNGHVWPSRAAPQTGQSSTDPRTLPLGRGLKSPSTRLSSLFLVYVNDIFDLHLSPSANLMVYADDILLSKPITTSSDLTALQSDLNLISDWLSNNLLTMNVNKTKLMIISRKRPTTSNSSLHPACVYVNGSPLEVVKCFKYLGVWISQTSLIFHI